jgi:cysteinyl-tRNA synthetase
VETFEPLHPPRVTLYVCGPTVWSHAHIGNFRTFLLGDLLRRYLEFLGYEVFQIMNLTDVDDRLITAAGQAGHQLSEHTEPFVEAFFRDRDYLHIEPAQVYPRATEYIDVMAGLVASLMERDLAYLADDGSVYFAVGSFKGYGKLSQLDRRQLKAGARVSSDEYDKEDVRDFALWKAASPEDEAVGAAWDADFGRGRPGWHLECSAMALGELRRRFGVETLDIHAGGVDLIFPHHENEIAQSEGATGETFARYWVHGEFLTVEGTKMSKRYGNYLTVHDVRDEGIDPAAVRLLMFQTHYRQRFNLSDKGLSDAVEAVARLADFRRRVAEIAGETQGDDPPEAAHELEREFRNAMDDDLNAPKAVGALFNFIRRANRELDEGAWAPGAAGAALELFDRVADVLQLHPAGRDADPELASWVEEQILARRHAREAKDFGAADAIRDTLKARGVVLEDTAEGTRWKLAER